ncbi:MAG: hypothetical protein HN417_01515 [Desulfobacula sp.]|jgi:hypothetical protein|nr:hypothetical protein [Desulfobacula sp.]
MTKFRYKRRNQITGYMNIGKYLIACLGLGCMMIVLLARINVQASELHVGIGKDYPTIKSAISMSAPGDIIYIHDGIYYENNLMPKPNTTLSGVEGEGIPVIDAQQKYSNHAWNNNPIYILGSHIRIKGLEIRNGSAGNIVIEDSGISHIEITHCVLRRSFMPKTRDNAALVYVKPNTRHISIHHNYFETKTEGFHAALFFRPHGGTTSFYNNEIRVNASASGFFVKHGGDVTGRLQVYNNFIMMNYSGHHTATGIFISQDNVDVKNNLIIGNAGKGIWVGLDAGGCGGSGSVIDHNTVFLANAVRGALSIDNDCNPTNILFKNNILHRLNQSREYRVVNAWIYGSKQAWRGHHNLIFENHPGSTIINTSNGSYTMRSWKIGGQGRGSVNERPVFSNKSGTYTRISDFEVIAGSANNCADNGTDIGADVSVVGRKVDAK